MKDWTKVKYFKQEEFDSPDVKGSGEEMNEKLILLLDDLRDKIGQPLKITSGFSTVRYNSAIHGAINSAHMRGKAADISANTTLLRFKIVNEALKLGIVRMEIAPLHIHIDIDETLPQNVIIHLASY